MEITRREIIGLIVFILLYICTSSLFAYEDNNNIVYYEAYDQLPDYSEHDEWDLKWVGKRSKDCYELTNRDCMKYSNCGLCYRDGKLNCVPGDEHGPLFKEGCTRWVHTNYRDRHIFGEKDVTISPPHDYAYTDYERWLPSPQSRATLFY